MPRERLDQVGLVRDPAAVDRWRNPQQERGVGVAARVHQREQRRPAPRHHQYARRGGGKHEPPAARCAGPRELLSERPAPGQAERIYGAAISQRVEHAFGQSRERAEPIRPSRQRRAAHTRHVERYDFNAL